MSEIWQEMAPRERGFLVAGALTVGFIVLYALAWEPLTEKVSGLQSSVQAQRELVSWMEQTTKQIELIRDQIGPELEDSEDDRSLLSVVDESARDSGLGQAVKRIEPADGGKLKIWLESAEFNTLVEWMADLQSEGIWAGTAQLSRTSASGRVNGRLTLSRLGG
ncbi:MAG: type II secretion system protein M [Candidatus Sedimenticola sp. PURPLELP]